MISLIDEPEIKTIEKESTIGTKSTSRSDYKSGWYKNMTPKQREARRERQRLHNVEPKRKEALKLSKKKFKEVRKHTLHLESIAMENPLYIPEVVWPTTGAYGNHGTTTKSSDWVIPEFSATPLYIPPPYEEDDDEGCDELLSGYMTKDHMFHLDKDMRC